LVYGRHNLPVFRPWFISENPAVFAGRQAQDFALPLVKHFQVLETLEGLCAAEPAGVSPLVYL